LDVELQGSNLEGVFAAWWEDDVRLDSSGRPGRQGSQRARLGAGLQAQVQAVEGGSRVRLRLVIAPDAPVGSHSLRLVSPHGVSNGQSFWVGPHPVIRETEESHGAPDRAQPVHFPVAISGRLPEQGRVGYYRFEVTRAQALAFEVLAFQGKEFDPQLNLYETTASWFDPHRVNRLLFREEETQGGMPANRRLTYQFAQPGRYLVRVSSIFARGGPDFTYLLRITRCDQPGDPPDALAWAQRRLDAIRSRTVEPPPGPAPELVRERKPGARSDPAFLTMPAILEGTIGRPGEIDTFQFHASPGSKLAFEVDTPCAGAPQFVPRLEVLDASGRLVITNLEIRDGALLRVARQAKGVLEKGGEYRLRVRDITSIQGSPDHVYRLLVRPQIPHVGAITVQGADPVNLVPGASRRLTLTVPLEEGYTGEFAVTVGGLPRGVQAFFSTTSSAVTLVADADAPLTSMPVVIRISGRPIIAGQPGPNLAVRELPMMVVKP
jgi:hypothetical protein